MRVTVRVAIVDDCAGLARMRAELWPDSSAEEHGQELLAIFKGEKKLVMPWVIFVAESESGELVGFVEVGLRSCADGCEPWQPVGYIEGWYVRKERRRSGVGRKLIAAAEDWARSHGCVDMASDSLIENGVSQRAHQSLGYEEVERSVHYRKTL